VDAIERLQKQWRESAQFRGLHASMSLEKNALVLGAGTVLAKRDGNGGLAIEDDEERLLTLLAVAYGRPADSSVLESIRAASKYARAGNESMAAMRIALAQLPQLADPEDASRRLFIADGLIVEGVPPRDIWCALEFDPTPLDVLEKYSPSELRNPKDEGRISGRWTSGSEAALEDTTAESLSSRIASLAAQRNTRCLDAMDRGSSMSKRFVIYTNWDPEADSAAIHAERVLESLAEFGLASPALRS
jgi:hypothetical protein